MNRKDRRKKKRNEAKKKAEDRAHARKARDLVPEASKGEDHQRRREDSLDGPEDEPVKSKFKVAWSTIFAGLAAVIAIPAYRVSQRALEESIKTTKLDERAWLGVSKIEGPSKLTTLSDFVYAIQITNTGKTPALHISELAEFKTLDASDVFDPKTEIATAKQTPERKGSLHPQAGFFLPMDMSTHVELPDHPEIKTVIPEGTFQRIRERKENYYVFGILNYSDVFGDAHTTTFCFKLQLVTDPPTFGADAICDSYSDYTDEKKAD